MILRNHSHRLPAFGRPTRAAPSAPQRRRSRRGSTLRPQRAAPSAATAASNTTSVPPRATSTGGARVAAQALGPHRSRRARSGSARRATARHRATPGGEHLARRRSDARARPRVAASPAHPSRNTASDPGALGQPTRRASSCTRAVASARGYAASRRRGGRRRSIQQPRAAPCRIEVGRRTRAIAGADRTPRGAGRRASRRQALWRDAVLAIDPAPPRTARAHTPPSSTRNSSNCWRIWARGVGAASPIAAQFSGQSGHHAVVDVHERALGASSPTSARRPAADRGRASARRRRACRARCGVVRARWWAGERDGGETDGTSIPKLARAGLSRYRASLGTRALPRFPLGRGPRGSSPALKGARPGGFDLFPLSGGSPCSARSTRPAPWSLSSSLARRVFSESPLASARKTSAPTTTPRRPTSRAPTPPPAVGTATGQSRGRERHHHVLLGQRAVAEHPAAPALDQVHRVRRVAAAEDKLALADRARTRPAQLRVPLVRDDRAGGRRRRRGIGVVERGLLGVGRDVELGHPIARRGACAARARAAAEACSSAPARARGRRWARARAACSRRRRARRRRPSASTRARGRRASGGPSHRGRRAASRRRSRRRPSRHPSGARSRGRRGAPSRRRRCARRGTPRAARGRGSGRDETLRPWTHGWDTARRRCTVGSGRAAAASGRARAPAATPPPTSRSRGRRRRRAPPRGAQARALGVGVEQVGAGEQDRHARPSDHRSTSAP